MRNLILILFAFFALASCSEFQKALKSEDTVEKYKMAEEYFNQEKWSKANRLFAQVVPSFRGKPQAERLMYMYSKSYYMMKDYHLAGYQFERFEDAYPMSDKAEEASFLGAKSYYYLSPVYSKEQEETKEAIEKLQLFINKYPESEYLAEANVIVNELDFKLEKKAFEIAKLYNKTAYFESSDYEAAIKSFDLFLFDFPGSTLREDAMFYRLQSAHHLAINSIQSKKLERINNAKGYYDTLTKYFPETEFLEDAEEMNQELDSELATFNLKS